MSDMVQAERLTLTGARDLAQGLMAAIPERPSVIALFGSTARGEHTPQSDVDLLVITQRFQVTKQNRRYASNKLQIIEGSVDALSARVMRAPRDRNPFLLNLLGDAVLLLGEQPPLDALKDLAAKVRLRGPQPVGADRLRIRLSQCADARDKMLHATSDLVRAAAAMRAITALQGCLAIKNRLWLSLGLSRGKEFRDLFPAYGEALETDSLQALRSGAFDRLATTISRILEKEFPASATDETAFAI